MKVKVFNTNENGKIEFTKEELENLLNEVYDEAIRSVTLTGHYGGSDLYTRAVISNACN